MFNLLQRDLLIWNSLRASPFLYFFIFISNALINPNILNYYLILWYIAVFFSNNVLKNVIFSSIYKIFNLKNPYILGIGHRPNDATNCGVFLNLDNKIASSFGMPSGHSQLAWAVSTFLILYLLDNNKINNKKNNNNKNNNNKNNNNIIIKILINKNYKMFAIIILLLFALLVSFSRVYVDKCHTIQQVIMGGLFGILSGIIGFYGYKLINNYL